MGGKGTDGASQCRTSLGLFWSGRVIPPAVAALLTSPAEVWRLLVEPRRIPVPVAAGGATYTLSAPTYAPGSITSTGMTARVTVTAA